MSFYASVENGNNPITKKLDANNWDEAEKEISQLTQEDVFWDSANKEQIKIFSVVGEFNINQTDELTPFYNEFGGES